MLRICRYKYFPNQRSVQGFGTAPAQPRAEFRPGQQDGGGGGGGGPRRYDWGRGNILGGQ